LLVSVTLLRRRNGAPENERILLRYVLEFVDRETEILSDNLEWSVDQPVGKDKRGPGGIEVAI
jgi:hypothetical protein